MLQQHVEEVKNFKGYSLFKDVECEKLKHRNRGVVMANIIEDNLKGDIISNIGTASLIGYFRHIPAEERNLAYKVCSEELKLRGIRYKEG